ncbi:MAG: FliI/YscN family ATPase [Pseudomonadota bacterium]
MKLLRGFGRLIRQTGALLTASGVRARIGDLCWGYFDAHARKDGPNDCVALQVVGFDAERVVLLPLGAADRLFPGMLVSDGVAPPVPIANYARGRVIDGFGRPIDAGPPLPMTHDGQRSFVPSPLQRAPIREPFDTGVRAINGLFTVGEGQRVGLFAGSGVGKSVLLSMLARAPAVDVVVCALIGERGREVESFVRMLFADGAHNVIVVAAPASDAPGLRLRAAQLAHDLADAERAAGRRVLLLFDSLSRVAQAQREIGLAAGEPPTSKGYPPSVFTLLQGLVERGGTLINAGSITAFYTVLMEEDDPDDPILDAARAVLDGHILLSRESAERGLYPAIDVGASASRLALDLQHDDWANAARAFRRAWRAIENTRDLVLVGAYEAGSDADVDRALAMKTALEAYLAQEPAQQCDLSTAEELLLALMRAGDSGLPRVDAV